MVTCINISVRFHSNIPQNYDIMIKINFVVLIIIVVSVVILLLVIKKRIPNNRPAPKANNNGFKERKSGWFSNNYRDFTMFGLSPPTDFNNPIYQADDESLPQCRYATKLK